MSKLLTEADIVNKLRIMAEDMGIRGAARHLKCRPGDVHRIVSGNKGAGKVVPALMGYEVRYVRKT